MKIAPDGRQVGDRGRECFINQTVRLSKFSDDGRTGQYGQQSWLRPFALATGSSQLERAFGKEPGCASELGSASGSELECASGQELEPGPRPSGRELEPEQLPFEQELELGRHPSAQELVPEPKRRPRNQQLPTSKRKTKCVAYLKPPGK